MSDEVIRLTQEGLEKLKSELHELKTVRRKELAIRLEVAKELGDLSENADYQQAKEDSAWTEGRINQLNDIISRSEIADAPISGVVSIGTTVRISGNGKESVFKIVGATEADPAAGRISVESPIGSALINSKVGDTVTVSTPSGDIEYTVLEI